MEDIGLIGLPLLSETEFPISIITRNSTGVPTVATSATWIMYSPDFGTQITTGTYDMGTDSKDGFCTDTIDLSALGSLESGKVYTILSPYVISAVTRYVIASFQPQ
jgi:hypothetical protein